MIFQIGRTSSKIPPCDEAFPFTFTHTDKYEERQFLDNSYFARNWENVGYNHRLENGYRLRDVDTQDWAVEIESLKDLFALYEKYGELIIRHSYVADGTKCIEIYDSYRE